MVGVAHTNFREGDDCYIVLKSPNDSFEYLKAKFVQELPQTDPGWDYLRKKFLPKHAKAVIGLTEGMRQYALEKYGTTLQNYYVKPACVDLQQFDPSIGKDEALVKELDLADKIVCVYAGKIGGIYLDQEIFDFFRQCAVHWGERFAALLLTDTPRMGIEQMAKTSGLEPEIVRSRFVEQKNIQHYLELADFALNPVKSVPSKRYCTSIKDGEYWAMGLPVVITPNISDDSDIIAREDIGAVLQSLDEEGYTQAIIKIDRLLTTNKKDAIREVAERYRSYKIAEEIYKAIYS